MQNRAILYVVGGVFLCATITLIGVQLFRANAALLSAHLTSDIAVVTGLDDVLERSLYDETFLDPYSDSITVTGQYWMGTIEIHQRSDPYVHLLALTTAKSSLEVTCAEPTESVGVQFWGDGNDGLVEIIIDEDFVWHHDTRDFKEYVEFTALAFDVHTIRIHTLATGNIGETSNSGDTGNDGETGHVTIAGISCQQRGPVMSRIQRIYLPLVQG